MKERPLTLKIWFPLTIITYIFSLFTENLRRALTLPTGIPPELLSAYTTARLVAFVIINIAIITVYYGTWIGSRIAYIAMYAMLIIQMISALIGILSTVWFYEAIVQMALLAFSWQYFFK